ncbi:hypothetical protein AB7C87_17140 [Natrarchaeobius sp. A-rgal3]|uniref:hypothetical protein n=1 Tax=Natrarchaeobius versutus TaxID=1679078 RepID=UPI00350FC7CD
MKITNNSRYSYDTLYGQIRLDDWPWESEINEDFWDYYTSPELQRLREVRLCNINSLFLPGGANIDRFEHALGTYYLAKECLKNWPALDKITPEQKRNFLVGALFHDFKTSAFGHSVQYIEEKEGFKHEGDFFAAIRPGITEPIEPEEGDEADSSYEYNMASTDPVYVGRTPKLNTLLTNEALEDVGSLINGDGKLGPLISSDMDLDNIDNVFRLAYHIGLTNDTETPLQLAKALYIEDGKKVVPSEKIHLVKKWWKVREKLYKYLLLNPGEFSGKCMLTETVAFAKRQDYTLTWNKVDRELIDSLRQRPNYEKDDLPIYQFEFQDEGLSGIPKSVPEFVTNSFEDNKISLNESVEIEKHERGYALLESNRQFLLEREGDMLKVYRIGVESYSIQDTISRLMVGELYGCLSILSITGELESLDRLFDKFNNLDWRLEKSRELSAKLPDDLWSLRIQTRFHPIRDVDKTRRTVNLQLPTGEAKEVGDSSQRVLIGVFAANNNLTIHDIEELPREKRVRLETQITEFVQSLADEINTGIKVMTLETYGESKDE